MRVSTKRRLVFGAGALTTVAAAATLVAGVTFGFFSASATSGDNSFSSGTVALNSPATTTCTVTNIVPGDSSAGFSPKPIGQTDPPSATCTFTVTNNSSVATYLGVYLVVSGTGLYDQTPSGLNYQIGDGTTSFTTGGSLNDNGGAANDPLLLSTTADAANSGAVHTISVDWALPIGVGNSYATLGSTLTITIQAVQAANNGSTAGCTAGIQCTAGITAWG